MPNFFETLWVLKQFICKTKKVQKSMHDKGLTAKIIKKKYKVGKRTKTKYCVESAGRRK